MCKNYNDNNINNDKDDDNNLSLIIVQTAWKLYNTGNSLPLTLRANSTRQSHSAEDAHPQVYADFPETFRWKGIGFSSCVLSFSIISFYFLFVLGFFSDFFLHFAVPCSYLFIPLLSLTFYFAVCSCPYLFFLIPIPPSFSVLPSTLF